MGRYDADGLRLLMAAVIERAIDDLKGNDLYCPAIETDRAMAFILSEDCELFCLEMDINYEAVKEKAAALYKPL